MCTPDNPCGGILVADRCMTKLEEVSLEEEQAPRFVHCLNGHRFPDRPIAVPRRLTAPDAGQCLRHQRPRPCESCRVEMQALRAKQKTPDRPCACGCGLPVMKGRQKYATNACALEVDRKRYGKTLTREELLRHREILRAGLYEAHA